MATITQERLTQLLEIYAKMKADIILIDEKYSLTYKEPEIDIPDSLNLEKMPYNPKSEEELRSLAEAYCAPTIISKQRSLDSSYMTKSKALVRKRSEALRTATDKYVKSEQEYNQELEKLRVKLTNHGLLYSTTATKSRKRALSDYGKRDMYIREDYNKDLQEIDVEEQDLESVYSDACLKLEEEGKVLEERRYQALCEIELKNKTSIDKYNNSIEEKEQRFQMSRAKFIESMRRSERDRVLDMTKLYLQLGEVSYRDRMLREKYAKAQDYFWPLRRNEAHALLGYDSFLVVHLESYYSAFVDWVNTYLLLPNN